MLLAALMPLGEAGFRAGPLAGALQAVLQLAQIAQALISSAALQLAASLEVVVQIGCTEPDQGLGLLMLQVKGAGGGPVRQGRQRHHQG